MATEKKSGIWLDDLNARLEEYHSAEGEQNVTELPLTQQVKNPVAGNRENVIHSKEYLQQSEYHKKLDEAIRNYNEVILFGATTVKVDLFNALNTEMQ